MGGGGRGFAPPDLPHDHTLDLQRFGDLPQALGQRGVDLVGGDLYEPGRDVGDQPLESKLLVAGRQQPRLEIEAVADVDHVGDDVVGVPFAEQPRADFDGHGGTILADANHRAARHRHAAFRPPPQRAEEVALRSRGSGKQDIQRLADQLSGLVPEHAVGAVVRGQDLFLNVHDDDALRGVFQRRVDCRNEVADRLEIPTRRPSKRRR